MGFLNPFFLFGVLSAAVPVVIHFWSRRQARTVEFSTLRFLLEAHRRTVRRFQLEHWLLLAMRMLVLVCFSLALARPIVQAGGWFARARAQTCAVILLDNSASMGYRGVEGTVFERGKTRALEVLRSLQPGDEVGVVLMSDRPVSLLEPPSTQRSEVQQALRTAPLTSRRTRVEGAVAYAMGLLRRSSAPNRELYLITDFAQTAWNLSALDTEGAQVFLLPVGEDENANASIETVRLLSPFVAVNLPVTFSVTIRNWGDQPMSQRTLEFLVDEEVRASRVLAIPPRSEIQERITHTFDTPGLHAVHLRLNEDRLPEDDIYHLAVRVMGEIPVTVVGNDPLYLSLALRPNGEPGVRTAIQPTAVSPATFQGDSWGTVLFFQNPFLGDPQTQTRIEGHLLNGGICVLFLGNAAGSFRHIEWLPVESEGVFSFRKPAKLRPATDEPYAQQLFGVFEEDSWMKPSAPNFYRAHRLRVRDSARILARFDDGTPALVDVPVKGGRVFLLNSPADRSEWSNLPLSPLFVPLIQQLTLTAVAELTPSPLSLTVGDLYERPLSPADPVSVRVTTPAGQNRILSADGSRLIFSETETTGIYRIVSAEEESVRGGFSDAFAVNVPVEESDVTPAPPEIVESAFREKPTWLNEDTSSDFGTALQERRLGRELSGYFLGFALVLILLESLLSNRLRGREETVEVPQGLRVGRQGGSV